MHTIKHGVIQFGPLMSVHVGVCSMVKTTTKESKFKTLHVDCSTPLKQKMCCPTCDVEVSNGDKVKGIELTKGQYLPIDPEELAAAETDPTPIIRITKVVDMEEVAPAWVEKTYMLEPAHPLLVDSYELLMAALVSKELIAVGVNALWGKDRPCVIVPDNGVLTLSMLHTSGALIEPDFTDLFKGVKEQELTLAEQMVDLMTEPFDPVEDMRAPGRERLEEFLAAKVQGLSFEPETPEPAPAPTVNIIDTLNKSIEVLQAAKAIEA